MTAKIGCALQQLAQFGSFSLLVHARQAVEIAQALGIVSSRPSAHGVYGFK